MKTLEEFQSDISEYLLTLKARNGIDIAPISTRDKWQKVLNSIVLVLIQNGHETPDEKDYEEYRASKKLKDETFATYKGKIEEFFFWSKERRQEKMPEETKTSEVSTQVEPVVDSEPVESESETVHDEESSQVAGVVEAEKEIAADAEPSQVTDKKESNAGRKKFDTVNGEKRNQKLMLYLTPSVIEDVRDWCSLKKLTVNNYVTALIEADLRDKQNKLNSFRQLRDEA